MITPRWFALCFSWCWFFI